MIMTNRKRLNMKNREGAGYEGLNDYWGGKTFPNAKEAC